MTTKAFQLSAILARLPFTVAVYAIPRQTRPIAEYSDLYSIALTYCDVACSLSKWC